MDSRSTAADGCRPGIRLRLIVRAFDQGEEHASLWENAHTIAAGIRVPAAVGDFLILRAVHQSNGFATAVDDDAILAAQQQAATQEGVLLCPEGAATLAAYQQELRSGRISGDESVVLFNCATGLKYPMPPVNQTLDCSQKIDYHGLS